MSAPKKRTVASLLSCAVNQDDKQRLAVLYKAISFEKKAILEIERKQKRQQKQLEEVALGLQERVHFLGFRQDLPALLQAIDIACIPSRNEAFGLTVIEAMAAQCAVVGANSGAIPELIDQQRGRLADPLSAEEWSVALKELIDAPETRRVLGEEARRWVVAHMALDVHAKKRHDSA